MVSNDADSPRQPTLNDSSCLPRVGRFLQLWEMKKVGSAAASISNPGPLSARTEVSEGATSARSTRSAVQVIALFEFKSLLKPLVNPIEP
jgi:hypothetical protein